MEKRKKRRRRKTFPILLLALLLVLVLLALVVVAVAVWCCQGAAPPHAALVPVESQPTVRTDNVLSVSQASAELAGFVDSNQAVTAWFEYGEGGGSQFEMRTSPVSAGGGGVSKEVLGLKPGTIYAFRLVAETSGGQIFGEVRTFMTEP